MLLAYLYCLGARRRQWMPFWPQFATAGERFVENTSSSTFKLITRYFIDLYKTPPMSPWPTPADVRPLVGLGRSIKLMP